MPRPYRDYVAAALIDSRDGTPSVKGCTLFGPPSPTLDLGDDDLIVPNGPDCEGGDDRGPDDDPDTDDEFIKVRRVGGYVPRSWSWTGDPLYAIFSTAQAAKAAAERYYHRHTLEWWEEGKNYWMAERPGCRMTEAWAGPPDDCDEGEAGFDGSGGAP